MYFFFVPEHSLLWQKFTFQFWTKFWFLDVIEGKLHEGKNFIDTKFNMETLCWDINEVFCTNLLRFGAVIIVRIEMKIACDINGVTATILIILK